MKCQAWKLRCDGSVDEAEHEEDLRIILIEVQPGRSGYGTTKPVDGSQGSLVLLQLLFVRHRKA